MKKCWLLLLALVCALTSCAGGSLLQDQPVHTVTLVYHEWYDAHTPVQPFGVSGIDEVRKFIVEKDYQYFIEKIEGRVRVSEYEIMAYDHMSEMIRKKGFLKLLSCYESNNNITLYPYMNYEDVGVCSECTCEDEGYRCIVYYIDEELAKDCPTVKEYCDKRFGSQYYSKGKFREMKVGDQSVTVIIYPSNSNSFNRCIFLLDGFFIRIMYKSHLSSILKNLSFVTVPLEQPTVAQKNN